ncbi:HNH endonuclease [Rhodococcus sp. EPR-157]|uniref:HNH endonuclease n=1 Tax=Rhodococcus sp. EPR-157 TaxID=1813677 RepID=UPI000ACC6263|nr:HNH endonuclease [Rhodococcus sp. EPR-157]
MVCDLDTRLRDAAMDWLKIRTNDGLESISSNDLLDFRFDGEPFRLMDPQRGIRKPKELAAALSIRTVYRPDGAKRPYEDEMGDDGLLRYKWRGEDLDHPENRALRSAMELELPLIWFFGVGVAMYQPIFPVYLLAEEPERHQFVIIPGAIRGLVDATSPAESQLRRYVMAESKRRLHQPVFRATVMRAYDTRCAVCSLAHGQLLDAAHIVPDSDEAGIPTVRNGLAMCKIHHAAYDAHILGVSPDYIVKIRADLLDEIDGPMLQYGLKERHDQKLMVLPSVRAQRPDRDLLSISYERFRSA